MLFFFVAHSSGGSTAPTKNKPSADDGPLGIDTIWRAVLSSPT